MLEEVYDDEKLDLHELIINILSIFVSLFCLLCSMLVVIIHIKKSFLRKGFFKVVFALSILEFFLNLELIINSLYVLIKNQAINPGKVGETIFGFIFNFLLTSLISYNIVTIIYLYFQSTKKDTLTEKEIADDENLQYSVKILNYSFLYIHLISLGIGLCHSILLVCFCNFGNTLWHLFYLSMKGGYIQSAYNILIFIPHYVLVLTSIPYLILSWNKAKISDHIRLKHYAIYTIFLAIFCIVFPLGMFLVSKLLSKEELSSNDSTEIIILKYLVSSFLNIFLLKSSVYRIKCYYVQSVLRNEGGSFCDKVVNGIKILFCLKEVKNLDFVDFNSNFVYHSLATTNDFLNESQISTDNLDVYDILGPNQDNDSSK